MAAVDPVRGRTPTDWAMAGTVTVFMLGASDRELALNSYACDHADDVVRPVKRQRERDPLLLCSWWKGIDAKRGRELEPAAYLVFDIDNQGKVHVSLSGTCRSAKGRTGTKSASVEVVETVPKELIALTRGTASSLRRGGTAYDDVAAEIILQLSLATVGFSVNADNGATSPAGKVGAAIMGAAPGSIVLAHMNHPASGTSAGVATAIPALSAAGWEFVRLSGQSVQ